MLFQVDDDEVEVVRLQSQLQLERRSRTSRRSKFRMGTSQPLGLWVGGGVHVDLHRFSKAFGLIFTGFHHVFIDFQRLLGDFQ